MLMLLAVDDHKYCRRLGELLRGDGHQVVHAAGFDGCNHFLERSRADLIVLGIGAGEMFPRGLRRPSAGTTLVVLTESGGPPVPGLPDGVWCIERPADPQELLGALTIPFEQAQGGTGREPNRTAARAIDPSPSECARS